MPPKATNDSSTASAHKEDTEGKEKASGLIKEAANREDEKNKEDVSDARSRHALPAQALSLLTRKNTRSQSELASNYLEPRLQSMNTVFLKKSQA